MARLSKQQVLDAPLRTEEVDVPEWGGSVLVGEMPVSKRGELLKRFMSNDGKSATVTPELELDIFIAGCLDPAFSQADAKALQAVSGAAVGRVARVAMKLNGLSGETLDEARGES